MKLTDAQQKTIDNNRLILILLRESVEKFRSDGNEKLFIDNLELALNTLKNTPDKDNLDHERFERINIQLPTSLLNKMKEKKRTTKMSVSEIARNCIKNSLDLVK